MWSLNCSITLLHQHEPAWHRFAVASVDLPSDARWIHVEAAVVVVDATLSTNTGADPPPLVLVRTLDVPVDHAWLIRHCEVFLQPREDLRIRCKHIYELAYMRQ